MMSMVVWCCGFDVLAYGICIGTDGGRRGSVVRMSLGTGGVIVGFGCGWAVSCE
jgi:hypothetical protein